MNYFEPSVGKKSKNACIFMFHPANDDISLGYSSGISSDQHWLSKNRKQPTFVTNQNSILKALAHYKDFHKDFSEKIVVKIFVHIQNCWKNRCSFKKKL